MDAPLSSIAESGPLATTLVADLLLEQTWAATAPETWFAAPLIVVITCAFAVSQSLETNQPFSNVLDRVRALIRSQRGAHAVIAAALRELRVMAMAREILIAVEGPSVPALLFCEAAGASGAGAPRPITRDTRHMYFFGSSFFGSTLDRRSVHTFAAADAHHIVSDSFRQAHPHDRIVAVALETGEWRARLFLLDPADDTHEPLDGRLEGALEQQLPMLARMCELHIGCHRAEGRERARLGRELHDGIVQELSCLDMELELVGAAAPDLNFRERIARIQERLRAELRNLRNLIQDARYSDVDASQLPLVLEGMVQRFARDARLEADYVSNVSDVRLPPQVCGEIARIVQEALVNIRRHSGARRVVVTFSCTDADWNLSIQDDGQGFEKARNGVSADGTVLPPSVIHERVHLLGGTVRVTAAGSSGARLEISARPRSVWNRMA